MVFISPSQWFKLLRLFIKSLSLSEGLHVYCHCQHTVYQMRQKKNCENNEKQDELVGFVSDGGSDNTRFKIM